MQGVFIGTRSLSEVPVSCYAYIICNIRELFSSFRACVVPMSFRTLFACVQLGFSLNSTLFPMRVQQIVKVFIDPASTIRHSYYLDSVISVQALISSYSYDWGQKDKQLERISLVLYICSCSILSAVFVTELQLEDWHMCKEGRFCSLDSSLDNLEQQTSLYFWYQSGILIVGYLVLITHNFILLLAKLCCYWSGKKQNMTYQFCYGLFKTLQTGVAFTFENLRIANAQHGKNCVGSPAAKTAISTDLPKICPGHDRAGLQTAHRPFWLRHQQYVGTSIPSPGWDREGRGRGREEI